MFQTTNQKKQWKILHFKTNWLIPPLTAHSRILHLLSHLSQTPPQLCRNQRFQNIPPTNKKCFLLINVAGFRKPIDWYCCFSNFGTQTYHWVSIIFRPLFGASMRKPHDMDLSKTNGREKPLVYHWTNGHQLGWQVDDHLLPTETQ